MKNVLFAKFNFGEHHVVYGKAVGNLSNLGRKQGEWEGSKDGYLKCIGIKKDLYD